MAVSPQTTKNEIAAIMAKDPHPIVRRAEVSLLLNIAKSLHVQGQITSVSKGFLKDLIVQEDSRVFGTVDDIDIEKDKLQVISELLKPFIADQAEQAFELVFEGCSSQQIHKVAHEEAEKLAAATQTRELAMMYGEVEFKSFRDVLLYAGAGLECSSGGLKFYDLGSGTGRAVMAAVLTLDFQYAIGIEKLNGLYEASQAVLASWQKLVMPRIDHAPLIKLYHGSFLNPEYDWADGDLVFANSTCFDDHLLRAITVRAEAMRAGARVITLSVALRSLWFKVIRKMAATMSWGPTTVYIHEKLSDADFSVRLTTPMEYDEDQNIRRPAQNRKLMVPSAPPSEYPASECGSLDVQASETDASVNLDMGVPPKAPAHAPIRRKRSPTDRDNDPPEAFAKLWPEGLVPPTHFVQ